MSPLSRSVIGTLLSATFLTFFVAVALAEEGSEQVDAITDTAEAISTVVNSGDEKPEKKSRDFVAMPIPVSNPTIGTGLAGIVMWIHRFDDVSPPSTAMHRGLLHQYGIKGHLCQ